MRGVLVGYSFKPVERDQLYLMPPSLREWLPEGDLAWFIVDAVEQMELGQFYAKYRRDGIGHPGYEPSMMVGLLLYAYCLGEKSSRRIEQLCARDIGFRVVAANHIPDHTTIARFRQDNEKELADLFTQVLELAAKSGLVKVGVLAVDGSKIKANASLAASRKHSSIKAEVEKILAEAEAKDREEDKLYGPDRRGDELPEELRNRASRLARLKAAKEILEKEAAERAADQAAKIAEQEAEERSTGKKRRGRKPKEPTENPEDTAKANVTDPESRIMKSRSGYLQGYNAQAVATENQIIVAAEVTQEANDVKQLVPVVDKARENIAAVTQGEGPKTVLADAGYWSEANMVALASEGPELMVATLKDWKQRRENRDRPCPRGRIPAKLSARDRMERKLLTKRGRALYKKRSVIIEPIFGQIKDARGLDRFARRGLAAADSEWKVICLTHNLLKIWRSTQNRVTGTMASRTGRPLVAR